jgi:hypothetical protein
MQAMGPRPPEGSGPRLYVPDEAGWGEELWRGVELLLEPGAPGERLWFEGDEDAWGRWLRGTFREVLAPGILRARHAAASGVREWAEADRDFGARLGRGAAAERSLRAGRRMMASRAGARHFMGWERITRWLAEEPEGGHGAMVSAFFGAGFHVSPGGCLVAWVYEEWRASFPGLGREAFLARTPDLGRQLAEWLEAGRSFPALQSPDGEPE